jgi:hypothetical protein
MFQVESEKNPTHSRAYKYLPAIVGLLVAATVAVSAGLPSAKVVSWVSLFVLALQRIFEASLACVMTTAIVSALVSRRVRLDTDSILVRTSLAALWLPALALFFWQNSVWAMATVAIFAVMATRSFFLLQEDAAPTAEEPTPNIHLFSFQPSLRPQISVIASLCVQTAVLAFATDHALEAWLLFAGGFAIWTWCFTAYQERGSHASRAGHLFQSQRLTAAALAVLLTVVGLMPYLQKRRGWAGSHGIYPWHASSGNRTTGSPRAKAETLPPMGTNAGNTGIVLWPEKEIVTKLIAPPPLRESLSLENFSKANPLIVPFNGVYWYYRAPDVRPPKTSRQAHASPDAVEIRSTDRRPLSIEAYDHLGTLIDLDCCSKIQVAIRNTDRYPDTVSLELTLINTSLPQKPSQSLGSMMVRSTRPWNIFDQPEPVTETLNFLVPLRRSLQRFDEMKIVFRLDRARADAGARIAIDHFVLVPRGL